MLQITTRKLLVALKAKARKLNLLLNEKNTERRRKEAQNKAWIPGSYLTVERPLNST